MGDMADMAIENAMDDIEEYDRFLEGKLSPQEAYDAGITNEYGGVEEFLLYKTKSIVKCKYCGNVDVYWENRNDKWILFDKETSKSHYCKEYFQKGKKGE